jgi:tetratricopeptide (TPR) repeat protein
MQAEQVLSIIKQPKKIDTAEVQELRKLLHQYPYFQLACTLIAKALYDQEPDKAQQAIQLAAVYATDRNQLKLLLEDKLVYIHSNKAATNDIVLQEAPATHSQLKPNTERPPQIDFINSYISNISTKEEKRITKEKSLEQLNIIENFIKKGSKFKPLTIKELSLEEAHIDLTKESITLHDSLLTESLAQVMLKQGKFERAIEIYKRLQLKFPEKGSYFSTLTEELKKDI